MYTIVTHADIEEFKNTAIEVAKMNGKFYDTTHVAGWLREWLQISENLALEILVRFGWEFCESIIRDNE